MDNPKYEPHFHGPVQGVVIGDNNKVTFIFQSGEQRTVTFIAPPRPPYDLVGRDKLLRDLRQHLFTGGSLALCALNGLPGVGKTALAVELAHDRDVLEHFQDGVLWAGLGFRADVLTHLGEWGAALGIPSDEISKLTSIEDRAKAIHAAIGIRCMLLVADDAWQSEAALTFKLGGPNCAHLVTTRLPEVALRFAGDGTKVVGELRESDALARLAPEVLEAEPDEARELVRAVGGLPLALILMGNYLRVQAHGADNRVVCAWLSISYGRPKNACSWPNRRHQWSATPACPQVHGYRCRLSLASVTKRWMKSHDALSDRYRFSRINQTLSQRSGAGGIHRGRKDA